MNLFGYNYRGAFALGYSVVPFQIDKPAPGACKPAHHIKVIDASGSMYADMADVQAMIAKVMAAEDLLAPNLRLSLISYSTAGDVITHFAHVPAPTAADPRSDANRQVKNLRTRGMTCISQGLQAAIALIRPDETTVVSLHTDGWANDPSASSERKALLGLAAQLRQKGAWLSAIAYRSSSDFQLLSELAGIAGGSAVQATSTRQVYDAIHSGASRAAGPQAPAIKLPAPPKGGFHLFLSTTARRVEIVDSATTITGLRADDTAEAWTFSPNKDAHAELQRKAPDQIDDAPLALRAALARALLARRDLTGAKQIVYGFGSSEFAALHGRALTPEGLTLLSADLDSIVFNGLSLNLDGKRGMGHADAASILKILGILAEAPEGAVLLDVERLMQTYVSRGLKRIPGKRGEDGTLTPPPVKAIPRSEEGSPWRAVQGVGMSQNAANATITCVQPIDLQRTADGKLVRQVAGVNLTDLKTFRAYTVIADGAPTVRALRLLVPHAPTRHALERAGLVSVNHTSVVNDPLKARQLHVEPMSLDHVYEVDLASRPVIAMTGPDTVSAIKNYVIASMRLATLDKMIAALRKGGESTTYTAAQVAALKEVCVSENGYFSPPMTEAHADMQAAILNGEVDSRTVYKIDLGTPELPRGAADLYGGNEGFARYATIDGAAKPTLPMLLEGKPAKPKAVKKENAADAIQRPLYQRALGLEATTAELPGDIVDFCAEIKRTMASSASDRLGWLKRIGAIATTNLEEARAFLRPIIWTAAATGMLPAELPGEMLDAEAYMKAFPGASLPQSQKNSSFFCIPSAAKCEVVLTVTPETKRYTVKLPADLADAED